MAELKDFIVFSDLSPRDLAEFEKNIKQIRYGAGEIIYQEGAPTFGFYLLFEGQVKEVKRSLGGKKQILKLLGPGELLGETTLFDKGVHISYTKTLSRSVVGFVERGDFYAFLLKYPAG